MLRYRVPAYDFLGICEHCGKILSLLGMPVESMDAELVCPHCSVSISHKSFGYEQQGDGDWKKIRWVVNGEWTDVDPSLASVSS